MTETKAPVAHRDSPYFGLDYYDEKFGAWFFGRETDGSKIITNLRAARLTLVHAESGVGKTSLLRAGVAWRLHRLADDTFARGRPVRSIPVVFSSWKDDPTTELATAVGAAVRPYLGNGAMPAPAGGPLDAAVEAASGAAGAGLLIMLDQFEEYFLYRSREPVPERFADELARCVNRTDLRANFVIAIREDAYAELGDLFKGRITNVYGNYLHIDYLDRASAEKAIRGPVEVYNGQPGVAQPVTVQDELVEAVLDEVRAFGRDGPVSAAAADGGRDRIATPLLQLVMQRVWDTERAEDSAELRLSTLQRLRGVRMIVDDHLGQALGSLSGAEREAAIDMFDHLVTPSGGKIAESVSDLAKRTGHSETQVDEVLRKLDDERILRPVPAAPGQDPVRSRRYEIFHDVLASPINRAIAAREEQRRIRRFRRLAALAVTLLVVVAAVAVVFAYLLNSANTEKLTAESRQLAADADLNLAHDPELSTSLAMQALKLSSTSQAEDALRAGLPGLQVLRTIHDGSAVSAAAFDPADPDKVASADSTGTVWIWDVRTGRRLERLVYGDYAKTGEASTVAFSPDGSRVAVGYQGSSHVVVFDARSGQVYKTTSLNENVLGLEFVGNTGKLAIAGPDLALWKYDTAKCCDYSVNLPGHGGIALAANPHNPDQFAAAEVNGVFILTIDHAGKLHKVLLSNQITAGLQFSPDGGEIVMVKNDGSVYVYRVATRKVVTIISARGTSAADAAFSPDGKQIVAGYEDGTARVWDIATKLQKTLLTGHTGAISSVQFSPSGQEIATASHDGTIRVWYAEPRELRAEFTVPTGNGEFDVLGGAGYVSGQIITAEASGNVFVYSASGKLETTIHPGTGGQGASWNRAGTKIAILTYQGRHPTGATELWRATHSGYTLQRTFGPYGSTEYSAAISPDGSRVAITTDDSALEQSGSFNSSNLVIWVRNVDTGRLVRTLHAVKPVQAFAFNPDGRQIVGTDASGQIETWNGTATHPRVLGNPGPDLLRVSFNHSGSEFVTTSAGGVISVWNARDGRALTSINACPSPNDAGFSPDGSKLVVACTDGTVRVFDAPTGRALTVIQATGTGDAFDAGFSPDGTSIVVGVNNGKTGEIQIWNAELATSSLAALERIGEQRVGDKLTPTQVQQYLNGTAN